MPPQLSIVFWQFVYHLALGDMKTKTWRLRLLSMEIKDHKMLAAINVKVSQLCVEHNDLRCSFSEFMLIFIN